MGGILDVGPDDPEHIVQVFNHLGVGEPEDGEALAVEPMRAFQIVFHGPCVGVTINLNHKPSRGAQEVSNEGTDGYLSTETMPQLLVTET